MDKQLYRDVETQLLESRRKWQRRLDAIRADRRRQNAPLDADFGEQAIQRENDDTLDSLDVRGRAELAAIDAALARIADKTFGSCVECGEPIAAERLRAQPTATSCFGCAADRRVS